MHKGHSFADVQDGNAKAKLGNKLHHIHIEHHMENGEVTSHTFEPGDKAGAMAHLNEHMGGEEEPAEAPSAAGAAYNESHRSIPVHAFVASSWLCHGIDGKPLVMPKFCPYCGIVITKIEQSPAALMFAR